MPYFPNTSNPNKRPSKVCWLLYSLDSPVADALIVMTSPDRFERRALHGLPGRVVEERGRLLNQHGCRLARKQGVPPLMQAEARQSMIDRCGEDHGVVVGQFPSRASNGSSL